MTRPGAPGPNRGAPLDRGSPQQISHRPATEVAASSRRPLRWPWAMSGAGNDRSRGDGVCLRSCVAGRPTWCSLLLRKRRRWGRDWGAQGGLGLKIVSIQQLLGDGVRRRARPSAARPDLGPSAGRHRRSQRNFLVRATVMRHFLRPPLAKPRLAGRVQARAAAGALIARARSLQRPPSCPGGAVSAVPLATVAPRADDQLSVAQRAEQQPSRYRAGAVQGQISSPPRGWTSSARCATNLSKPRRGGYGQARAK